MTYILRYRWRSLSGTSTATSGPTANDTPNAEPSRRACRQHSMCVYDRGLTYSTVDPDSDGKIISRLSTSRTDDVQGQTVLRDGVAESRCVGAITIADVAVLRSITRFIPRLVDRLRRRKAKRASGRLSIRDTQEELLVVVLVAHAMICSVAEIDRRRAGQIIRVRGSIAG